MEYYIQKKLSKNQDSFSIYNSNENIFLHAAKESFTGAPIFHLLNQQNKSVAIVAKKSFLFWKEFQLQRNNIHIATMKKNKHGYEVFGLSWTILSKGNEYEIKKDELSIAKMSINEKSILVQTNDSFDQITILALFSMIIYLGD